MHRESEVGKPRQTGFFIKFSFQGNEEILDTAALWSQLLLRHICTDMAEYKKCWIISIYKAKYFSVVYPNSLYMYTMLNQFTFGSWDTYIRKPPILPSTFSSSLGHINAYHRPIYIFFPRNGFTIHTIFTLTRNEKIQEDKF